MSKRCALVLGVVAVFLSAALVAKAQDQVGAPKMLTPEIVKNAVGLVKEGKRYSLARTLEIGVPTHPFHHPLFYVTYRTVPESLKMFSEFENQVGAMNERVEMVMHTGTHLDALNHISRGMKLYSGYDANQITTSAGTSALGVHNVPSLVTRGVLIDLPGLKGVEYLDKGYAITPKDIEDALARQGTLFRQAYSHAPLTCPSHASILTGLLPTRHGVRDNGGYVLRRDVTTLAERFGEAGYRTGAFVSAFVLDRRFGLARGFQDSDMGYASALAWVFFAILLVFTAVQFRIQRYWVYYEGESHR